MSGTGTFFLDENTINADGKRIKVFCAIKELPDGEESDELMERIESALRSRLWSVLGGFASFVVVYIHPPHKIFKSAVPLSGGKQASCYLVEKSDWVGDLSEKFVVKWYESPKKSLEEFASKVVMQSFRFPGLVQPCLNSEGRTIYLYCVENDSLWIIMDHIQGRVVEDYLYGDSSVGTSECLAGDGASICFDSPEAETSEDSTHIMIRPILEEGGLVLNTKHFGKAVPLPPWKRLIIAAGLAQTLYFLQKVKFAHSDLHGGNIMVDVVELNREMYANGDLLLVLLMPLQLHSAISIMVVMLTIGVV